MLLTSTFKPAWWLRSAHGQTILAKYLRPKLKANGITEVFTLADGDFIELLWSELPATKANKPIIILLHGLAGSSASHYIKGMMQALSQAGFIALLMHFRGCGSKPNHQAKSYHSGAYHDFAELVIHLQQHFPNHPLAAIGFSLGGNVLVNYLAKLAHNPLTAAAMVCAPLHLATCSKRINQGFSKLYQRYLINNLKRATEHKISQGLIASISIKALAEVKTIYQFDQLVTAPINGFIDAEDYYQQVSGRDLLQHITTPSLVIHAKDDPFLAHHHILPRSKLCSNIYFEVANHGGHVGFVAGRNPFRPQFYLEQRIPQFLAEQFV